MADLSATRPGRYTVEIGGEPHRVEIDAEATVRVEGDDGPFRLERVAPGEYRVSSPAGSWRVFVSGAGTSRDVFVDGEVYRCEVRPEGARRRRRAAPLEPLASPMPARVVAVRRRPGDAVRRGEVLITLEAMKMELAIRAPRDGVLRALDCEPGQLVPAGVRLAQLE